MKTLISKYGDFWGAFADTAILLPIISLLAIHAGFSMTTLLFTAGLAYFFSAWWFKIPMSVQPLKSIAIAALAVGATSTEIRISAFAISIFCLVLLFFKIENFLVDETVIHAVQIGLGVLLITQGLKMLNINVLNLSGSHFRFEEIALVSAIIVVIISSDFYYKLPVLGIFTFLVFVYSMIFPLPATETATPVTIGINAFTANNEALRYSVIASLVLPQMVLTTANSVLGTTLAAKRYYPNTSSKVTPKRLLWSIGLGNIFTSLISGLPFCHGAGGLTAHYKAGAKTFKMNCVIGGALLIMSSVSYFSHLSLQLPVLACAAILITVGCFHFQLGQQTFKTNQGKIILSAAAFTTLMTSNLLITLVLTVVLHWALNLKRLARNA